MRRILALIMAICLAVTLAACSGAAPDAVPTAIDDNAILNNDASQLTATAKAPEHPSPSMHAISLPVCKEAVFSDDGTELMTLSFQNIQVMLGNEAAQEAIIGDIQTRRGSILTEAEQIEEAARRDYPESDAWGSYFIDFSYTPTRLDRAVLSLFGSRFTYSGGPHPSLSTDSVTYDLENGGLLFLDEILDPSCTADSLCQLILKSLAEQNQELYYDYEAAVRDRFTSDLHSIQAWYFSRRGLCFHFAPYDIAPYSSGTIIAEIPYEELEGIILEKFLFTEVAEATGSMYAKAYAQEDAQTFTTVCDVTVDEIGTEVLLHPDALVTDVRIETGTRYTDTQQFIALSTAFAADRMDVCDAIRLSADLSDPETPLRLQYRSAGQEYSAFISYDAATDSVVLAN